MSKQQKAQIQFTSFSHSGWQRNNNEDALLVDAKLGILLADGMGGHAGGESPVKWLVNKSTSP
ncbi:MAG: hypothetical protein U5L01_01725 [Rheinheimera sp.]|nr:hypothetical protein [Rheinheimera sp.]